MDILHPVNRVELGALALPRLWTLPTVLKLQGHQMKRGWISEDEVPSRDQKAV